MRSPFSTHLFRWMIAVTVPALMVTGCMRRSASLSPVIVLKLAHNLDVGHPVHRGMVHMQQYLRKHSAGRIDIQIFPAGQLGSERETLELVQLGGLDMVKASCAQVEGFIPVMGVFSVPYIFTDRDHYWRVLDGKTGQSILQAGESVGLRGLCFYDAGSRNFYTRSRPVTSPDDLKGLKIRVMQSRTSMAMIRALGASPTPITFGELYTALQQGVVDGAENNLPSFHITRHYEACKYLTLDEHTRIPDILMISALRWERFTPADRELILQAARESSRYQRDIWEQISSEALEAVTAKGVQVFTVSQKAFMDKVRPLHESYRSTPIGAILDEIARQEHP